MADSTSKMVMDWYGDASKALADMQKIIGKQDEMIKGLRETNKAAKESTQAFEGIKSASGEILGLLGIGGGIAGVMGLVKSEASAWVEHIKRALAEYKKINQEISASIALSGELSNFKEVQSRLAGLNIPVKQGERAQLFREVSRAAPTIGLDQKIELTRLAGMARPVMGDQTGGYAGQLGAMADIYNGKLSPDDIADVTAYANTAMGQDAGRLAGPGAEQIALLSSRGMDTTDAIGYLIAASKANLSKKFAGLVGLATTEQTFEPEIDPVTGKRRKINERERIAMELQAVAPKDRLAWLMANQGGKTDILAGSELAALGALSGESAAGEAANLRAAMAGNLAGRQLAGAAATSGVQGTAVGARLDVMEESQNMADAERFSPLELQIRKENIKRKRLWGGSGLGGRMAEALYGAAAAEPGGWQRDPADFQDTAEEKTAQTEIDSFRRALKENTDATNKLERTMREKSHTGFGVQD